MLEIIDCELGRLVGILNTAGILDETTIIVVGDNGSAPGVSRWPTDHEKPSIYEGGVRVPLIVSGPSGVVSGGRETDALVNTADLFATALELMGVNLEQALSGATVDSKSLLKILDNTEPSVRSTAYAEKFVADCTLSWFQAIREGDYKLVRSCPPCQPSEGCCFSRDNCDEELFNVVTDVRESDDKADEYPSIVDSLRSKLPGEDILCTSREGDLCFGCCSNSDCSGTTGTCEANHECCDEAYDDITVQWVGPSGDPALDEDYSVYNTIVDGQCLPHVVLKTTNDGQDQVDEYRIGRKDAQGNPLPLGGVTTDWPSSPTGIITVRVGYDEIVPALLVADVAMVNIDAQRGDTWSSASLDLSGDLHERAEVSNAATTLSGGRIRGDIAGTLKRIKAQAIGEAASGSGTLAAAGLSSGATIELASHPSTSTLTISGGGPNDSTIIVADSAGFVGPVTITEEFNGKLCAQKLDSANPGDLPSNIDVAFGNNGQVCDNPPSCTACGTPCPPATAETTVLAKNRYVSFRVPSTPTSYAIAVVLDSIPGFTEYEGQVRWVVSAGDNHVCHESGGTSSTFKCAKLGCDPEHKDWASLIGSDDLHVTGPEIIPDALYRVQIIRNSASENRCRLSGLAVTTGKWGNTYDLAEAPPQVNVLDVAVIKDKLLELSTAPTKPHVHLHGNALDPDVDLTILDLSDVVDVLVNEAAYPFSGPCVCPSPACPAPECGRCTNP